MIVLKTTRCTLYDVDLLGLVGLALLAAAGWGLVFAPLGRMWNEYRSLAAGRIEVEAGLATETRELEHFEQGLAELDQATATEANRIPTSQAYWRLLQDLTDLANQNQLELLSVAPQPMTTSGSYLVSDIKLAGRGRSLDFIRFLDRLAQQNPYQSLTDCSISRPLQADQPICELTWTVRLHFLPPGDSTAQPDAEPRAGQTQSPKDTRQARLQPRSAGPPGGGA